MPDRVEMRLGSSLFIVFLLASQLSWAQGRDTLGLQNAVRQLNAALIHKDGLALKKILCKNLTYGHSNGWVESRKELIRNLFNGKLAYTAIVHDSSEVSIDGNTGLVKTNGNYAVIMDNRFGQFKLNVLQLWVWKKRRWILMSRQSTQQER